MAEEGQAGAIAGLFGADPAPEGGAAEEQQPAAPEGRPEWVPEPFWVAGEDGKGRVDVQALAKSWSDTKAAHTTASQRAAALEKAVGQDQVPEAPDKYWQSLDMDALTEKAPNVSARSSDEARQAFLAAAHEMKLGPEKAQQLLSRYYERLEPHMPEVKDAQDAIREAVAYQGPNGQLIAQDVQAWLTERADAKAFSDEQMEVLGSLVRSGPGLSTLHVLMQASRSSGPPSAAAYQVIDRTSEERELKDLLADPMARRSRRAEIDARFNQLYGG